MSNPFVERLACGSELSPSDRELLETISARPRPVRARTQIAAEGDKPEDVHLVMGGIACRAKTLRDGGRQITALLLPGDFCDLHVTILGRLDHDIVALTACSVVDVSAADVRALTGHSATLLRAFWWSTLVDESIPREWLLSMGQRPAEQRLAHLFCEMLARLGVVGLAAADGFELPLTQEELGDVLGLTPVHVNRVLQSLRRVGLISLQGGRLHILDVRRLTAFAEFDPDYLHLAPDCLPRLTQVRASGSPAV